MINGKNIVAVMPAYNAEKTLRQTRDELPDNLVDEVVLVDDASSDSTIFIRNVRHGIGVLATSAKFLLRKAGIARTTLFE